MNDPFASWQRRLGQLLGYEVDVNDTLLIGTTSLRLSPDGRTGHFAGDYLRAPCDVETSLRARG